MAGGFIRQRGDAWQVIVHPAAIRSPASAATAPAPRVDEGRRPATVATLAQLLERWLEGLSWPGAPAPGQLQGRHRVDILPTLGQRPLRRLDIATLDRFYSELRGRGGVGGRPMAPATASGARDPAPGLDQAARWGWIRADPAAWPAHRGSGRPSSARPPSGGLSAPRDRLRG